MVLIAVKNCSLFLRNRFRNRKFYYAQKPTYSFCFSFYMQTWAWTGLDSQKVYHYQRWEVHLKPRFTILKKVSDSLESVQNLKTFKWWKPRQQLKFSLDGVDCSEKHVLPPEITLIPLSKFVSFQFCLPTSFSLLHASRYAAENYTQGREVSWNNYRQPNDLVNDENPVSNWNLAMMVLIALKFSLPTVLRILCFIAQTVLLIRSPI